MWKKTLILALLALAVGQVPARAGEAVPGPEGAPLRLASFEQLLDDYFTAHVNLVAAHASGDTAQEAILLATKGNAIAIVKDRLFAAPGSAEYVADLKAIDRRFKEGASSAEAVYDLARALQMHWEREYGKPLLERRAAGEKRAWWGGLLIGAVPMIAHQIKFAGAAVKPYAGFWKSVVAKDYVVPALPFLGAFFSQTSARLTEGFIEDNIPAPPLAILDLGKPWDPTIDGETFAQSALRDIGGMALMTTTNTLLGVALKGLGQLRAASALEGPYVGTLVNIALYFAIDYGLKRGIEAYNTTKVRDALAANLVRIQDLDRQGAASSLVLYQEADLALDNALLLSKRVYRPMVELAQAYNTRLEELATRYGGGTPDHKKFSDRAAEKYVTKLRQLQTRKIVGQADQLVQQIVAALRHSGRSFLTTQADFLETLRFREDLLMPQAMQPGTRAPASPRAPASVRQPLSARRPASALPVSDPRVGSVYQAKQIAEAIDVYLDYDLNQSDRNRLETKETLLGGIAELTAGLPLPQYQDLLQRVIADYLATPMHRPDIEKLADRLSDKYRDRVEISARQAPLAMAKAAAALVLVAAALHHGPGQLEKLGEVVRPSAERLGEVLKRVGDVRALNYKLWILPTPKDILLMPVNIAAMIFNTAGFPVKHLSRWMRAAPGVGYTVASTLGVSVAAFDKLYLSTRADARATLAVAQVQLLAQLEARQKEALIADRAEDLALVRAELEHLREVAPASMHGCIEQLLAASAPSAPARSSEAPAA
jgi:hypothetical protein